MNIQQAVDTLNFWISKERGSYYTIQEAVDAIHNGSIAHYNDLKTIYATSQLVKDQLAPFKRKYSFTPTDTISGYIVIPSNSEYSDLLDVQIQYNISNRTIFYDVAMVNEDARVAKLNSQVDPVSITSPVGEMGVPRYIQLYPVAGYTGTVSYLKSPTKPVYAYTLVSGRVIVYDSVNSVQLEWREADMTQVLLKALRSIGINLSDDNIQTFAQSATIQNAQNINHL